MQKNALRFMIITLLLSAASAANAQNPQQAQLPKKAAVSAAVPLPPPMEPPRASVLQVS